jgi:excinuclease ABC subunit A
MEVDRDLIVPNPRLTLAEGAIQPWMRIVGNQSFYQKLLAEVASAHKFSMDIPVEKLNSAAMQVVFYGTDGQLYEVDGKQVHFEGVIQNLLLRYNETDSDYVKKEIEEYMREARCSICAGRRLKPDSLAVRIGEHNIADIAEKTIEEAHEYFDELLKSITKPKKDDTVVISAAQTPIVIPICKEILKRLETLTRVGLSYLTLDRSVTTISGGEAQRIRLSTQLSSGLSDVVYILDEPSIGVHPKDTEELIDTLRALQKNGNTVVVVEHDNAMIEAADYVIDMGPGAGTRGGEVMAVGTPDQIKKNKKSLTGQYLANKEEIETPKKYRKGSGKFLTIRGAKAFNLKNVDVSLPLGTLLCVTGVSGSGKSTLISDVLSKSLHKQLYRAKAEPGAHDSIEGTNNIDKVITIDQKPIGRTPRSNPATYTGVFTAIRDLFTEVPEAKMRGLNAGMFSFNVKGGGRCEACAGDGSIRIPMQFLSDVYMECGECNGKRYTREALEVKLKEKTIADVLAMTIEDAVRFFSDVPTIREKLSVLQDVGLGYIQLGQSATTLSGGEAQRIKLATELSRRQTGKTLYILDEPTTGLHFDDIKRLLLVLNKLVDKGNTVLMIEHNIDVVKCSDWVVDMGPGGGKHGGNVVAEGTPRDVAKVKSSATAKYLKEVLK